MAARARGRGSRYGIDGTVLETSLGSVGTVLETDTPEAGRCKPYIRNAPSGAGAVQSRAAGAQEGFSRCRTAGETAGRPGADLEFCARCRAASMAHGACTDLKPVYRRLLKMVLEQLQFLEQQIGQLDQEMASLLSQHQHAVQRLAEVPGLGVDSAQQIIAEVGATAATFPSEKCLSSWVGACPGNDESAGVNYSHRSPKGNRQMRRILNHAANAAARSKGSNFEIVYRRSVPRLGHNQTIGAIAHRQCRLIWLILHQGVCYEERGPAVTKRSKQRRR